MGVKLPGDYKRVQIAFLDENGDQAVGRTEQTHKTECDINNILRRYDSTGLITHVNNTVAQYGDFSEVDDYQTSLQKVMDAENAFLALPSEARKFFENDPAKFLDFAADPKNHEVMVELGLAENKNNREDTKVSKSKKNSGTSSHKNEPDTGSASSEEQ